MNIDRNRGHRGNSHDECPQGDERNKWIERDS